MHAITRNEYDDGPSKQHSIEHGSRHTHTHESHSPPPRECENRPALLQMSKRDLRDCADRNTELMARGKQQKVGPDEDWMMERAVPSESTRRIVTWRSPLVHEEAVHAPSTSSEGDKADGCA